MLLRLTYIDYMGDVYHRHNSHNYHIRPNYAIDSNFSYICICTVKYVHMYFSLIYLVDCSINNCRIYAYLHLFSGITCTYEYITVLLCYNRSIRLLLSAHHYVMSTVLFLGMPKVQQPVFLLNGNKNEPVSLPSLLPSHLSDRI